MRAFLAASLLLVPIPVTGQTVSMAASRWLTDPHVTDYRLTVSSWRAGPILVFPFAQVAFQGPRTEGATLAGVGGDVVIRLTPDARPYLVGGVSGGFLDFRRSLGVGLWSSWSAGLGAELLRLGGVGVGLEGRVQRLSRGRTGGVSLGIRLGSALGQDRTSGVVIPRGLPAGPGAPESVSSPPASRPAQDAPVETLPLATSASVGPAAARSVLDAALDAMGTPYRWGGTDANGFDCSGLIQYAYARALLAVPRRSVDQARFGRSVGTTLDALSPGDILVFAARPGGSVSHVGLYLGEGRFIHSATGGTQISRLASSDPTGRWWFDRWIDTRRVIDAEG